MSPDENVDETVEESFPASDAPSATGETGIRLDVSDGRLTVRDNPATKRFELPVDGQTAYMDYERSDDSIRLLHTEVPKSLRRRGIGERLVKDVLASAQTQRLRVIAVCPFVKAYMQKHAGAADETSET